MIKDYSIEITANETGSGRVVTPKLNGFLHFFTHTIPIGEAVIKIYSENNKDIVFFNDRIKGTETIPIRLQREGEVHRDDLIFPVNEKVIIEIKDTTPNSKILITLRYEK